MFNFISWQSFLTITTLLVAGYYSVTSLMLYRKEIADWAKSLSHPSIPSPSTEPELNSTENLMGIAQALPESYAIRSSEISPEDIITSGKEEEPETIQSATGENFEIRRFYFHRAEFNLLLSIFISELTLSCTILP